MDNNNHLNPTVADSSNDASSTNSSSDPINRFVILQFGDGPQQDVIIDYRDNIRNAIVEQRRRQLSSSSSPRQLMTMAPITTPHTTSASASASASTSTTTQTQTSPQSPTGTQGQSGIRGIDYPAFDVTSDGVFGANRTSSRLLDLLTPGGGATAATEIPPTTTGASAMPFTASSTTTGGSNRNIILTVNYEYSSGVEQDEARDRSASLVLNVPNVPQGEDEDRLQALIRFATIILFRTIAMSLQNKQRGISEDQFAKLPIKKLSEVKEKNCPICYDDLEEPSNKRNRDDEDEEIENPSKNSKISNNNKNDKVPTSDTQKSDQTKGNVKISYNHIPVEMPCKHVFGQDCLHEWLKLNNSCPLCRYKLYDENRNTDGIQTTTMNLPNLARFLNDNSRDSLLNGEINRLPMLVVNNDSDPSAAAESLNNDLRNSLNNVPIIVTTAPATIPSISSIPTSPSIGGFSSGAGWNRFTRENIVRRIINSLTNSVGGGLGVGPSSSSSSSSSSASAAAAAAAAALASASTIRHRFPVLPSFREQQLQRRERANRRAGGGSDNTTSSSGLEFINRDPLFPVGVSSRRTANGVETVNVSGDLIGGGERPIPEDYSIQDSIVDDLLYGGNATNVNTNTNNNESNDITSNNDESNNDDNTSGDPHD